LNLRRRLLLSHVLPLVISIPLVGLLLISALEDRVIIPTLTSQVQEDARIFLQLVPSPPIILDSSTAAQNFVDIYADDAPWRLMLVDPEGVILASNETSDCARVGQPTCEPESVELVQKGQTVLHVDFSTSLNSRIIDYWLPVVQDGQLHGMVRISQPLSDVLDTFIRLRTTVIVILFGGLLLGGLIGLGLAQTMERPLRRLVEAMNAMSSGDHPRRVSSSGPEELQQLANAFNSLVARLEREADTRKQLLANLVHELGRPLGALRSAIQALAGGAGQNPELGADLLAGMDMQTRGIERLVEDLTQLYDHERGSLELQRVVTDLNQWFQTSTHTWHALAEEKGIIWLSGDEKLPPLAIDPVRLGQAWGNLLSNAIKFTPAGGAIRVTAQRIADEVRLTVTDSGAGLSPDDQTKIFVPFFRSNHSHRFPQGMGLGLSIAEDLVRAHQGYLEFHSELGKGSTFSICLPLDPESARPSLAPDAS